MFFDSDTKNYKYNKAHTILFLSVTTHRLQERSIKTRIET